LTTAAPTSGFSALESALQARHARVEAALRQHCASLPAGRVAAAIEDALFAPAKRLRPILTLLVADVFETQPEVVVPGACAVELVHTASLILDDLPSMDDAKTRRGRPACHVQHGQAVAILAAFALMNKAFELLALGWQGGPDAAGRAALAHVLAQAIGLDGLIAGQAMDLTMTGRTIDLKTLEYIHSRKTGALFMAAAAMGAHAARASEPEQAALVAYAKNLGLAFQIVDDLIDATGDSAESGKDVRQDAAKTTFVSFAGVAGARQLAQELVDASVAALQGLGPRADSLRELARYVVSRKT
jgi:geranylgeranyl diphosphate synthase, type II